MMAALLPLQNAVANIKILGPQAALAQSLLVQARRGAHCDGLPDPEEAGQTVVKPDDGVGFGVDVVGVFFTHPDSETPAVGPISLAIAPGTMAAFVGPSGAGKTTLADLILGMNTPDSGSILINGMSAGRIIATIPGAISYVPQSPGVVSGTIAQNVALGVTDADIDERAVWNALEKAELADFVGRLPEGIHTSLGRQSDALSGGQKQRLGLARALYADPRLLVLDEATSALDAGVEASISKTIEKLGPGTTVIVIAHRLSTIKNADVVFVFDNGRISASGTFSEVRKQVPHIEQAVKHLSFE